MRTNNHITKSLMHPVYVWELPVRFFHWINALSVLALIVTGYLMGTPPAIQSSLEASNSYWFGTIRLIHFISAYVFFFNFLVRIYWGFVGNRFANWKNFIPYRKRQWRDIWEIFRVDVFQVKCEDNPYLGHNALASFVYFLLFLVFVLTVLTGFGLYSASSGAWFSSLFTWVPVVLGGDMATRTIHHILMWFFIIFAIIHVYLVFYHDYIDWNGTMSSIIGGWKFQEEGKEEREKELEK